MGAQTSGIAIRLYFHISVHSSIRTFTRMAALLSVKWQPSVTSADDNFFHFLFLVLCYLVSRTA